MSALPALPKYESLQVFQQRLSAKIQAAQAQNNAEQLRLHVHIAGRGLLLALPDMREIIEPKPITPVPLTKPWFLGLTNLRGELTGVVDAACCLGWLTQVSTPSASHRWVVFSPALGLTCAITVDAVLGLVNIATGSWQVCDIEDGRLLRALPWLHPERTHDLAQACYGKVYCMGDANDTAAMWACEFSLQALGQTSVFLQPERD